MRILVLAVILASGCGADPSGSEEDEILSVLAAADGELDAATISAQTGIPPLRVDPQLRDLVGRGLISARGLATGMTYAITPAAWDAIR